MQASTVSPMVLAQLDLFAGFSVDELRDLAGRLRRRWYAKGDVIFYAGDPGDRLYLVEIGKVRLVLTSPEGREFVVDFAGPGQLFGDSDVFDAQPRLVDAVVHEPCQVIVLHRRDFVRVIETRPQVAVGLLAALSERLRRNIALLQDVAFQTVSTRLARTILGLVEPPDSASRPGTAKTSRLTQAELAGLVGTTRESVNKCLGHFERQGLIRRERNRIAVVRPDALRKHAG